MELIIGKNVLDSFTVGMYSDSKVIYREYIQNSCDSIDRAIAEKIVDKEQACVLIDIERNKRNITIRDNGTGISADSFYSTLIGNIANSDKKKGKEKGFRGIGRLCGLAYCKTLVFRSSFKGETVKSVLVLDASKMRKMLAENRKYTVSDVLDAITERQSENEDAESHYFEVELIGINDSNSELLDKQGVRAFLSFVAPVKIKNSFKFRDKIKEYADKIGFVIDEYDIIVNGQPVFKEYTHKIYDGIKEPIDEIFDVDFFDINNSLNERIAWGWYGLCRFQGAINKSNNPMYGFRVRQGNIQIGKNDVVAKLFKEDRGNSYFVGEIYTASEELIPNSQRDYFNENECRNDFEKALTEFFYMNLHKMYNTASKTRGMYRDLSNYLKKQAAYNNKQEHGFIDEGEEKQLINDLNIAAEKEKEARTKINKTVEKNRHEMSPIAAVQRAVLEEEEKKLKREKNVLTPPKREKTKESPLKILPKKTREKFFTDKLSRLNRGERKLVLNIMTILKDLATPDIIAKLQVAIEKEYK